MLKKTIAMLAVLLSAGMAHANPMAEFLGSDRPVIIFAPSTFDKRMLDQIGRFSGHRREYRDRDIAVIQIGGVNMRSNGRAVPHAPEMRALYGVGNDEFAIILVGKDGQEKLRRNEVTDPRVLYDLIDTMPLRQQEIERQREVNG